MGTIVALDETAGLRMKGFERNILSQCGDGCTNQEISEHLAIGESLVAATIESAKQQLGFYSDTQLMSWAIRERI